VVLNIGQYLEIYAPNKLKQALHAANPDATASTIWLQRGLQQMHYFAMVSIQLTSRMAGSECQLGSAR
jgi:hypothetical protein